MVKMWNAVYHGSKLGLLGKTALVRPGYRPGRVLAQFNYGKGMNETNTGGPLNFLCFGWFGFPASDFTVYPEPYDAP